MLIEVIFITTMFLLVHLNKETIKTKTFGLVPVQPHEKLLYLSLDNAWLGVVLGIFTWFWIYFVGN